jgi:Asparagine synthase
MAQAHRHSRTCAEAALKLPGRMQDALPTTTAVVAAFNDSRRTLEIVTSVSLGSRIHYAQDQDGSWVYSTSVPLLIANLARKPALDEAQLLAFALLTPRTRPPFHGVDTLGPGRRLLQRDDNAPTHSEWFVIDPTHPKGSVEDWVEQYCASLDRVLAVELPEEGNVSALMSAGLDSSMVVASAASVLGPDRRITAMCLDPFPPTEGTGDTGNWLYTDLPDAVSMQVRWPNVEVVGLRNDDCLTPLDVLPRVFDHTGTPRLNPWNAVWTYQAAMAAAARGENHVLTGQTGNRNFSWQPPDVVPRLLAHGQVGPAIDALKGRANASGRPVWNETARALVGPTWRYLRKPPPVSVEAIRATAARRNAFPFVRDDVMQRLTLWPKLDQTPFAPPRTTPWWTPGRLLPANVLLDMAIVKGVRMSDPLSAESLVRLVASLPDEAFVGEGPDRSFARRTMRGRVPDVIRLRRQRGKQAADTDQWIARRGDFRQRVEALAASPAVAALIDTDRWLANTPSEHTPWTIGFDRTLGIALFVHWNEQWSPTGDETRPTEDGKR